MDQTNWRKVGAVNRLQLSDYLQDLYKIGCKAQMYHDRLDGVPVGKERNDLAEKQMNCVEELNDALGSLQSKFTPFLKLNH